MSNEDYGWLESGFGLAFAVGGILYGVHRRPGQPALALSRPFCWPGPPWGSPPAGSRPTVSCFFCRVLLGFFEAGQWPCALAASQRLLSPHQPSPGQ